MKRYSDLIVVSLAVISFPWAHSQDTSAADSEAFARVKEYQIMEIDGEKEIPLEFSNQSALNWSNPVFGTTDGGFFLWTRNSRVAAVMKTYKTKNGRWFEQVRSFSIRPLIARQSRDEPPFWSPPPADELKPLENSPVPASTATARLIQMKVLHRSFSVTGTLNSGQQQLRPLPQLLYRYNSEECIDGALFAYVQGTGPDMLLILEARSLEDQPRWHYALGSIGIFEVAVQRGGVTVWTEPRRTAQTTKPTDIYDGRGLALP